MLGGRYRRKSGPIGYDGATGPNLLIPAGHEKSKCRFSRDLVSIMNFIGQERVVNFLSQERIEGAPE